MATTSIHVTLPQALKDHIEKRVAEGEFTSPSDYVRALVRAERAYQEKRAALLRDIDAGLADLEAGRVHDGEAVFAELLGEEDRGLLPVGRSRDDDRVDELTAIQAVEAFGQERAAAQCGERLRTIDSEPRAGTGGRDQCPDTSAFGGDV